MTDIAEDNFFMADTSNAPRFLCCLKTQCLPAMLEAGERIMTPQC